MPAQTHTDEDVRRLILDAYFQAICAAKLVMSLQGSDAQRAACRATATVVSKHTGRTITDTTIYETIRHAPGRSALPAKPSAAPIAPKLKSSRWW